MQVFMPYPGIKRSVYVLDNARLGNQVYREAKTLVNGGWKNHPVAKLWTGHRHALCRYALAGLDEMNRRGSWKPDVVPRWRDWFTTRLAEFPDTGLPSIIGVPEFHAAMRSNLLRKDPDWYSQWGWTEPDDLPYIYEVNK